jgi:aerobic-type carbon monoxide dehydrogenase small subunit (CoxS/CutS family)
MGADRDMPDDLELSINGTKVRVSADAERSLLSVLRDDLELTGAKYGCGEGQCGACTVLVDGVPTRSCITSVAAVASKPITTIEGLEHDGQLHPLQEAMLETGAMQCGYCTGGMIMSGVALLRSHPNPTVSDIIRFMEGNICRCGTYPRLIAAFSKAAAAMREAGK